MSIVNLALLHLITVERKKISTEPAANLIITIQISDGATFNGY